MSQIRLGLALVVGSLLLALVVSARSSCAAEVRTWTDVAGRKTEAKFVRVFNGEVILEKDGRMLKVPLARFSADDQKHIRELSTSPLATAKAASKGAAASREVANAAAATAQTKKDGASGQTAEKSAAKSAAAELRQMRDWRDNAGGVIKARFERVFGRQVVLAAGNRLRTIDFSRLSAADQEFVRKNLEAQGRAAEVPAAVAASSTDLTAGTAESSPTVSAGAAPGFPGSSFPNFGDLASRMRQQQEQIRATHDQMRSQVQQMQDEMKAARNRMAGSAPAPTPFSTPVAEASEPTTSAVDSAISTVAPPAVPDLSTPSPSQPAVAASPARDPFASPIGANRPERSIPRSPFERNTAAPTSGTPPNDPFAAAPAMETQYQEIIVCGACNKPQKPGFKAGQRCQHCGQIIDEIEDESGNIVDRSASSTRRNIKFWVWAVIAGISVIGGLIAKLKGS
jgi:hypothetical protein